MKATTVLVMTALVLCLAPYGAARAQWSDVTQSAPPLLRVAERGLTLDQAVALVERQFHARVVRADARSEGGHTVYVLRLLNDSGRVWTVHVDADSGAVR
jgi:uncharacterized membrane protein YkoI